MELRNKTVLVTGAAGYIGSVLVRKLLRRGYFVRGLDTLKFGDESLKGLYKHKNFEFLKGDIRKEAHLKKAIEKINSVIHLAAIVGDPACAKQPVLAKETNWEASKMLFDFCNKAKNVKKFIFASSCSNYGKMDADKYVNEECLLKPLSLYAELKVKFEKYLLRHSTRGGLIAVSLRFATAFGISPRMRFDLTVNEFIKEAVLDKELIVYGEQFWRPYCHVEDLARACICVLEAEEELIDRDVFNVGDTAENYQKETIVDLIKERFPRMKVRFVQKDEDPRDYRVSFEKIKKKLKFQISKTVADGMDEIIASINSGAIKDPDSPVYRNI